MAHPSSSRVNFEQNAAVFSKNILKSRPSPPSTHPPAPPSTSGRDEFNDYVAFGGPRSDDESTLGSPYGETSVDDMSSSPSSSFSSPRLSTQLDAASPEPAPITRDVMLYHFHPKPDASAFGRGLHSISKADPRLATYTVADIDKKVPASVDKKPPWRASVAKAVCAPPGLAAPQQKAKPNVVAPPPGLELLVGGAMPGPVTYSPSTFRKEIMAIFKDLALDKNVAQAVRRVRVQGVPHDRQAAEMADAVTYALEESRGAVRRTFVAFLAGLSAAFERRACISGLDQFFQDVYPDLQDEVPKLGRLIDIELIPTLRSIFTQAEIRSFLPVEFSMM